MTTEEEIIKANAKNGYIFVADVRGNHLYKKKTEPGGYEYWSDEAGAFFCAFDSTTVSNATLDAIYNDVKNQK